MLNPIRRRQTGRRWAMAVALTALPPHLAGPPERRREVDAVVLREVFQDHRVVLLCRGDPGLEGRGREHVSLLGHVTVRKTAELGAADLAGSGDARVDVHDVVDARHGIALVAAL